MKNEELRRARGFFIRHSKFEILHSSVYPSSAPSLRSGPPSPGGRRLSMPRRSYPYSTVGALYREFEQTLELCSRRFASKPREEMIHLFLLALEREEIVAVGYRENAIARRLPTMEIDDDERELIRHALIWLWKAD